MREVLYVKVKIDIRVERNRLPRACDKVKSLDGESYFVQVAH